MPPSEGATAVPPTPPEQPAQWTPPHSHFLKKPKFLIPLILILAAIIAFIVLAVMHGINSGNLFDQALGNALSTKNFTQYNTDGKSYMTIQYDVSKPSDTIVRSDGKLAPSGSTIAFNGYGTFKNSFMKFTTFTSDGKPAQPGALNKWFQVRKDGFDASSGYFAALFQNDPHASFFGDLIFGNFSPSDKSKLLNYIHQHNVYKIDPKKVQHTTYKGEKVAVYDMTENKDALIAFNKFVGNLIGLSSSDVSQDTSNLNLAGSAKMYVSESSKQFIHLQTKDSTVDYNKYGSTNVGGAPAPQTTFEQFENQLLNITPTNTQQT